MSHSETTVTFGLGNAEKLDSLYIYWPDGKKEIFNNINGGQEIYIIEGQSKLAAQ